jgi:hypothetical protein
VYDLIQLWIAGNSGGCRKSHRHHPVQITIDRLKPIGCRPATQVDEDHIFGVSLGVSSRYESGDAGIVPVPCNRSFFRGGNMIKDHKQRWLTALVVTAIVFAVTVAVFAQTPPGQSASAASPSAAKVSSPQFQPTPEQVADSLMAHQHYQQAIESYQKIPPTADVWNKMGVA